MAPITSTKMGVVEFKVPASELLILLPMVAKMNAGSKYPINPESTRRSPFFFGNVEILVKAQGDRVRPAIKILAAPISIGVKA